MKALFCTTAWVALATATAASAQPSSSTPITIDEVTVTAQKRAENVSKVPISVTVVSAQSLNDSDSKTLSHLQGIVPGITIAGTGSYGGTSIAVRGTSGANIPLQDDPVAVYVDEVYQASNGFAVTNLADVRAVEVVRGPQGTLQGRNATAGAVLVRTADPEQEFGGMIRGSYADPSQVRLEAFVTGPISENLTARLAFDHFNEEGWARNLFDGRQIGGQRSLNARGVLMWRPSEQASVRLAVNYLDQTNSLATVRWGQTTISPAPGRAVLTPTPNIPLPESAERFYLDGKVVNLNIRPENDYKSPSLALQAEYVFGPVRLVSITGASRYDNNGVSDSDSLAMTDRQGHNTGKLTGRSVSEEVRLQSNNGTSVDWIVGLYGSMTTSDMLFDIYNDFLSVARNQVVSFDSHQTNPSYAIFGDATWRMTDQISLTGGIRRTIESKNFRNTFKLVNLGAGATLSNVAFDAPERTWRDTSYRAKVSYVPNNDLLLYASYSKGFKSGGYNSFGVGVQPGYDPETLESAEVGVKAYMFDRRAYVAASAYDNTYTNMQVTSGVPAGGVVITNAATAAIRGFEIEGELRLLESFKITGNVANIDAKFESFPLAPNILGVLTDASGNSLTNAPEWQYYAQAQYENHLTENWDLTAQINWRWRDKVYFTPTNQDLRNLQGEANGELGARVSFNDAARDLTFSIYGTNLTDSRVVTGEGITFAYPQAFFNRPRVVGVQLEKRF